MEHGLFDGAPPLPRHEADVHVKGQPCLDDAAAFLWALAWKCNPQREVIPPGAALGRSSFPTLFQCTNLQLSFWNTLMAAMAPAGGALDFAGCGVLSDADVANRCVELRQLDSSSPAGLLVDVAHSFEVAADAAAVEIDRDALLRRAEAIYAVG